MSQPSQVPNFKKRGAIALTFLILAFLCFLFGFEYFRKSIVPQKPEFMRAIDFVKSSASIRKEFGELRGVEYMRFPFRYGFSTSGYNDGKFSFLVDGTKASDFVVVYWRYERDMDRFSVTRLTRGKAFGVSSELPPK